MLRDDTPATPQTWLVSTGHLKGDRLAALPPGSEEGDLMVGLDSSAIGTRVERSARFTLLLHRPRMPEHGAH
ncbi:MAG: hypothetical protein LC797_22170 [Chloroflexi bacterium]|nr:hypothetical protein [Chloroflexota bacterium]